MGNPASLWFLLTESLKITCARSYVWFLHSLIFCQGWDCFWQPNVLSRLSKITYLLKVSKNKQGKSWFGQSQQNDYQFWTAQCQQNEQFENPYITSHGEARSIKFKEQGKHHSKGSIGYPTSEGTDVITTYPCDFDKSLYL